MQLRWQEEIGYVPVIGGTGQDVEFVVGDGRRVRTRGFQQSLGPVRIGISIRSVGKELVHRNGIKYIPRQNVGPYFADQNQLPINSTNSTHPVSSIDKREHERMDCQNYTHS